MAKWRTKEEEDRDNDFDEFISLINSAQVSIIMDMPERYMGKMSKEDRKQYIMNMLGSTFPIFHDFSEGDWYPAPPEAVVRVCVPKTMVCKTIPLSSLNIDYDYVPKRMKLIGRGD